MFETLFFWLSKIFWLLISPGNFLLVLSTLAALLGFFGNRQLAGQLLLVLLIGSWMVSLLPVGSWLLIPLEQRFRPPKLEQAPDGIIMLGGNELISLSHYWQQVELNAYSERALAFMSLARRYPEARLVFAGGSGKLSKNPLKEADIAKSLFKSQGLDTGRIEFESQSRNTYENAVFAHKLVQPKPGETWLLITSAAHMPRAYGVFSRVGWPVIPYPVDHWTLPDRPWGLGFSLTQGLDQLGRGLHEWLGLIAYRLTGKTSALFPGR